jgi:Glycosyl hydrolase family 20, domain 2
MGSWFQSFFDKLRTKLLFDLQSIDYYSHGSGTPVNAILRRVFLVARQMKHSFLLCLILVSGRLGSSLAQSLPPVFPTPQFYETLPGALILNRGESVAVVVPTHFEPPIRIAIQLLSEKLRDLGLNPRITQITTSQTVSSDTLTIYLAPSSLAIVENLRATAILSPEDHRLLETRPSRGQEYVVVTRPQERTVYLIGGDAQGVLYATASLLQLLTKANDAVTIPVVHIRDFPDFKYRMAADWLMNVEINRWSYDWGDGVAGYVARIKRKLDLCTKYKINMVLAHGFGWGTEFFPGFATMMRALNSYARDRGIRMVTGGYGASYGIAYQSGPLYEEAPYLGKTFKNRDSYPDGALYQCMGFSHSKDPTIDTRTLGSCRSNEALNALKAAELREYVEKTEPGGLYIHHEDFGGYEGSQRSWLQRCARCRERWPDDELKAPHGGAGGLANGYRKLIEAIQSVKDPQTGYDAARDCTIILVSPVYHTDSHSQTDWDNVLELWQNIGKQLPKSSNVEICFRETFPLEGTARKWVPDFNRTMSEAELPFRIFMFFSGGADYFTSDYPVVASPAMNRLFLGSETIYNGSSGFNQEPLQLINAEYGWNSRSTGFFQDPGTYEEAVTLWENYRLNQSQPPPVFDSGGLLERVCQLLYGRQAGRQVAQVHSSFSQAEEKETPPDMWPRLYPMSVLWRNLAVDSAGWKREIEDPKLKRFLVGKGMDSAEYHRKMASRWAKWAKLSSEGVKHLEDALSEADLRPDSRTDVEHHRLCLSVGAKFSDLLSSLHVWLAAEGKEGNVLVPSLRVKTVELEAYIGRSFGTEVIDPSGGDIRSWLAALKKIRVLVDSGYSSVGLP